MDKYKPGVAVAAGSMMLKWTLMNSLLEQTSVKINPGDNVNVFINFESILNNLTRQRGLIQLINFHKQEFVIELESAILNMIANYRMYFNYLKCNPYIYLYYTDIDSEEYQMHFQNKYYRTYYKNQYTKNPQYRNIGEIMKSIIIPEVSLILQYVNHCYFITSKTFDGSVIPKIVSTFNDYKNIIISSDVFDTLYMFDPIFDVVYIKRKYGTFVTTSTVEETVRSIIKDESPFDLTIFNSEMYYRLLLSIKGSKIRNIKSAKGFGYDKFTHILNNGLQKGIVLRDFGSIDSIIELFPKDYRSDIKSAFQATSIDFQFDLLSDVDIDNIKSQIIDKVDNESVESLNNSRFLNFPINLSGLLN